MEPAPPPPRTGGGARYAFSSQWEVPAPAETVAAVLLDLEAYPQWWPEVRAVARVDDETAWLVCRSVLPYSLDLILEASIRTPPVLEVRLSGDLVGYARFTLTPIAEGARTLLDFDEEVRVSGRLLMAASYLLRPVLAWNHRRMILSCARGLTSRATAGGPAAGGDADSDADHRLDGPVDDQLVDRGGVAQGDHQQGQRGDREEAEGVVAPDQELADRLEHDDAEHQAE